MKIEALKKYWWVIPLIGYLGLGSYFEGLRPTFKFQLDAHAANSASELQGVACVTIVAGYIQAKRANDQSLIEYWERLAAEYQCSLPPV